MTNARQLRQRVNEAIIQALERGGVPWRSDHGFPRNVLSRRRYGGVEAVLLMRAGQRQGFTSCFWAVCGHELGGILGHKLLGAIVTACLSGILSPQAPFPCG
jgi:antirestriction protein ArdC